jgi:hypothetical protein
MDERERDKFYSPPDPTADDDAEYELEPLDPAIVDAEKRHAKVVAEQVKASIDIDEVYRDADRNRSTEILEGWLHNFKYRFHIKHLLFATAVLAIALAISTFGYLIPAIFILIIGSIAGLYLYLNWQDRQQQAEAHQRREELYDKRRKQLMAKGTSPAVIEPTQVIEPTPQVSTATNPAAEMWNEPPPPEPFRIQFSLRSLIFAMTAAAVTFGLIRILGGPGPTATILGLIAVGGLVVHAIGFEPPQSVILGWWFILLLYVLLTVVGAVWLGLA